VTEREEGLAGTPPFAHRAGGALILLGMFIVLGVYVAQWAIRKEVTSGENERDGAGVQAARERAKAATKRYQERVDECNATWRGVIATALPKGLLTAAEVPLTVDVGGRSLPIVGFSQESRPFVEAIAKDDKDRVLDRGTRRLMCELDLAAYDRTIGAGDLGDRNAVEAQRVVAEYEEKLGAFRPPAEVLVVDARCKEKSCVAAGAVLTLDGKIVGLARATGGGGFMVNMTSELEGRLFYAKKRARE
jgi:hypothetical protein